MKITVRRVLISPLLAIALALPASALGQEGPSGGPTQNKREFGRSHAPEFDPTTAGAIGAVLAGGGILLARRRKG